MSKATLVFMIIAIATLKIRSSEAGICSSTPLTAEGEEPPTPILVPSTLVNVPPIPVQMSSMPFQAPSLSVQQPSTSVQESSTTNTTPVVSSMEMLNREYEEINRRLMGLPTWSQNFLGTAKELGSECTEMNLLSLGQYVSILKDKKDIEDQDKDFLESELGIIRVGLIVNCFEIIERDVTNTYGELDLSSKAEKFHWARVIRKQLEDEIYLSLTLDKQAIQGEEQIDAPSSLKKGYFKLLSFKVKDDKEKIEDDGYISDEEVNRYDELGETLDPSRNKDLDNSLEEHFQLFEDLKKTYSNYKEYFISPDGPCSQLQPEKHEKMFKIMKNFLRHIVDHYYDLDMIKNLFEKNREAHKIPIEFFYLFTVCSHLDKIK